MWRPWSQNLLLAEMNVNSENGMDSPEWCNGNKDRPATTLLTATHKLPQVTWFLQPSKKPTKLIPRRGRPGVDKGGLHTSNSPPSCKGQKRKYSGDGDNQGSSVDVNSMQDDSATVVEVTTTSASEKINNPPKPSPKESMAVTLHKTMCAVNDLVPLERKRGGCTSTETLCQEDALCKTNIKINGAGTTAERQEVASVPGGTTLLTSTVTYAEVQTPGLVEKLHKPSRSFNYPRSDSKAINVNTRSDVTMVTSTGSPVPFPEGHGTTKDCTFLQGTSAHVTSVRCSSPPLSDIALPSDANPGVQTFHQVKLSLEKISSTSSGQNITQRTNEAVAPPVMAKNNSNNSSFTEGQCFSNLSAKSSCSEAMSLHEPMDNKPPLTILEEFCKKIPCVGDDVVDQVHRYIGIPSPTINRIQTSGNIVVEEPVDDGCDANLDTCLQDNSHSELIINEETEEISNESLVGFDKGKKETDRKCQDKLVISKDDVSVPPPLMYMPQLLPMPLNLQKNLRRKSCDNIVGQSPPTSPLHVGSQEGGSSAKNLKLKKSPSTRVSPSPPLVSPPLMQGFPVPFIVPSGDPRSLAQLPAPFLPGQLYGTIAAQIFPPGVPIPYPMMQAAPFWSQMGFPMPLGVPAPNKLKKEKSPPMSDEVPLPLDMTSPLNLRKTDQAKIDGENLGPSNLSPIPVTQADAAPPRKRRRVAGPRTRLNSKAVDLMRESFLRNRYPSAEEKEKLARKGGISVQQVNSWFTNYRRKIDYGRGNY